MKVCIVGTGYVGLTTGVMLAELGHEVYCIDMDQEKIKQLNKGVIPIYEPGVEQYLKKHLNRGLYFSTSMSDGVPRSEIIMLAVGTPPGEKGVPDLSSVLAVAKELVPFLTRYKVIINKSTVPVGTGRRISEILQDNGVDPAFFDVVSNPEFLREGTALEDSFFPDRIVIGGANPKAVQITRSLYKKIKAPVIITSLEAAEMIKYTANAFLAMKISFANEMAAICEGYNVDIIQVMEGVGLDRRIGPHFLRPGAGYGGSCLPKDLSGLLFLARQVRYRAPLLAAVEKVNDYQKARIIRKLRLALGNLKGKSIGIWGLAFKPNTDDMRAAPSLGLIRDLVNLGATVTAYDPISMPRAKPLLPPKVILANDMYQAIDGSHALVIVTEWDIFRQADLDYLKSLMRKWVIIDGRNIFDPSTMKEQNFLYFGTGR